MSLGKMDAYKDGNKCMFTDVIDLKYMVYMNFFGFVLPPLLAMFSIYGYIYAVVRKQIRKIYALQLATGSNRNTSSSAAGSNSSQGPVSTVSKRVEDSQTGNGTDLRLEELGSTRIRNGGTDAGVLKGTEKSCVEMSVNGLNTTEGKFRSVQL